MPFKANYLNPQGQLQQGLSTEEVRTAFEARAGLLWVDIFETTAQDGEFLERVFGFHPLAIEDCVSPRVLPPKVEQYGDHLFIVVDGVDYDTASDLVAPVELDLFVGPNFVVSNHLLPLPSVQAVRRLVEETGAPMRKGTDFLAYALIDALVQDAIPAIEKMDDRVEEIEGEALRTPHATYQEAILRFKRSAQRVHRVIAPQREAVHRLSLGEFPIVREEARAFYRDIYDHLVWIEDMSQILASRTESTLLVYLLSAANRQNEIMATLAVVATIFLPLTLITGIYGMNFKYMPELQWHWGYFVALGLMLAVAVFTMWWIWARQWIQLKQRRAEREPRPPTTEAERLLSHLTHPARWRTPQNSGRGPTT